MKKIFVLLSILLILILAYALLLNKKGFLMSLNLLPTGTPTSIGGSLMPTPTPKTKDNDLLNIKSLFVSKYNWNINDIKLTIKNNTGEFARGSVSNNLEQGGAMWFAAKQNGSWVLIWDGNGIIECSSLQNFSNIPTSIVPNCYDLVQQKLVDR